jgi:hypothetical protein
MRLPILLVLAATTSTAAHADTELGIGMVDRALHSPSANALTSDSLFGGTLAVSHALHVGPPQIALWLTGSMTVAAATGTMFEMDTTIAQEAFQGGVRARYPLSPHVGAIARAEVGMSNVDIKLADPVNQTLSDHAWAPLATGALGLEWSGLEDHGMAMGVRLELGYTACAPVELTAKTHPPDDGTLRLPMTQASLGSLDLSGKYLAASLLVRF